MYILPPPLRSGNILYLFLCMCPYFAQYKLDMIAYKYIKDFSIFMVWVYHNFFYWLPLGYFLNVNIFFTNILKPKKKVKFRSFQKM